MKLQHHIGGLEGLGPVDFEKRVFVEPWEQRIFGIHVAMMALSSQLEMASTPSGFNTVWTWADLRKGAESLNPFDYFKYRYYEKWLGGISKYFVDHGYISQSELDERAGQLLGNSSSKIADKGDPSIDARVTSYLIEGDSPRRETDILPRFKVGDVIEVKDPPSVEHTRLPGVLRNRVGVVETVYPDCYTYLTTIAADGVGPAMPVYCVRFAPDELWKGNTEDNMTFYADLYEAYISGYGSG